MFKEIVKLIFGEFVELYMFNFVTNELLSNQVILTSTDFDIIISYDEREDEIYIDFDLSRYMESKKYTEELQFPLYLNLDVICQSTNIRTADSCDYKKNSLEERIKVKFNLFQIIWIELVKQKNYKDVLSDMLILERIRLKELNLIQSLKAVLAKAHDFFKSHEYEKVVSLLTPHREILSEYDKKILIYSMKKVENR